LRLYEPTATFVAPDGSHATGLTEIRRLLREMLAAEPRITDVAGIASVLAGDLALMTNRWQMTFGALTEAPAVKGSSVEVARRQADGGWLYAIDRPAVEAPVL
jgi:ketosteroid isomerase-like protein